MYKPDRVILRKIREYDPHLFVEWNDKRQYFEVWRHMPHGRRLITPVTQSIYESNAPVVFAPLDERILWWLAEADSWRKGGSRKFALESDSRWKDFQRKLDRDRKAFFYESAKDIYSSANAFYATKYAKKNDPKPKFNKTSPYGQWVRPDSQSLSAPRVFGRTKSNAVKYGFKR
jgi:hypothetical protein